MIQNPFQVLDNRLTNIESLLLDIKHKAPTLQPPNDAEEFLTREETAIILKCSLPTLWDWTRKNILQSYRIGNKVRYKRNEVMSSPKAINAKKEELQP